MPSPSAHPASQRRQRARVAVVALFLPVAGVLLPTSAASAHSVLLKTDPRDGSTVGQAPESVSLTFNEAPRARYSVIHVVGPDGARRDSGPVRIVGDAVTESLTGGGPAGSYTVDWRVVSDDGHPVSGSFRYTAPAALAASAAPATATPAPVVGGPTAAAAAATPGSGRDSGIGTHLKHVGFGFAGAALVGLAWLYERVTRRRRADA